MTETLTELVKALSLYQELYSEGWVVCHGGRLHVIPGVPRGPLDPEEIRELTALGWRPPHGSRGWTLELETAATEDF